MLIIGLALIFNKQIRYFLMAHNQYNQVLSPKKLKENKKSKQPYDFDAIQPVSTEAVMKSQLSNQKLPVIGYIAMPDVKMKLPIFQGISNTALLYGAGTMKEGQQMGQGNYALASHRVDDPKLLFSPIQWAQEAMMIYITDLEQVYAYKTYSVTRVTPEHIEVIADVPNKKLITLVTCNDPEMAKRVIVHGELKNTYDAKNVPKEVSTAFDIDFTQVNW
jgi:sortase A